VASARASFVKQDIEQLRKHYSVQAIYFTPKSKVLTPFLMIGLFFSLLPFTRTCILVSFGGYHSFIACLVAKLKRIPCYIILNGVDVASIPEFDYGHLRSGILRFLCKKSYDWCTELLPVSASLMNTINSYSFSEPRALGLLNEFPNLHTSHFAIPNGFDLAFWNQTRDKQESSFITAASDSRLELKGVDLIVSLAQKMPESQFYIAGVGQLPGVPSNVHCLGYLSPTDLRDWFSMCGYYLQLSIWEGFGCALCEAMLCGCIPIVSNVNMMPEIVDDDALVLKKRSFEELLLLMEEVTSKSWEENHFRDRVAERFSISKRIEKLKKIVSG